jgi:hypothetical protein
LAVLDMIIFKTPPVHQSHKFKGDSKVIKIYFTNNDKDRIGLLKRE